MTYLVFRKIKITLYGGYEALFKNKYIALKKNDNKDHLGALLIKLQAVSHTYYFHISFTGIKSIHSPNRFIIYLYYYFLFAR